MYFFFIVFKKFNFLNRQVGQQDQSSEIISVCDLQFPTLLAMCKVILDMYYFGFTFHYFENLGYICHAETISFKHRHCNESKSKCWGKKKKPLEKNLFRCPRLTFNDLETDETIVVPLDFYISDSQLPKSYFSFLEENGAIYPQKYAFNVNLGKIGTELGDKYRGSIKSESDKSILQSLFLAIKSIRVRKE